MTTTIGFLIFPGVTPMDAVGPAQVLSLLPDASIHMIWKTRDPISTDAGFSIEPTDTLESCPPLNVLCVPSGIAQTHIMDDEAVLSFLAEQGS